jgi:hypothetical protein
MVAEHHPASLNSCSLAKAWNYFYKYRPVTVLYRPYPFLKLMAAGVIPPSPRCIPPNLGFRDLSAKSKFLAIG